MAPRANWKGFIKVGELTIPVALYTAASTSERIAFHILNRETGHRVHRQFIDEGTGDPVEKDDQVKGYETAKGEYVILEPDEIAAALPDSGKILAIDAFIACDEIDDTYLDRPYYLAPTDEVAAEAFVLLREGLRSRKVAALAQTVLFRRVRTLLIQAHAEGLVAATLNFDYEVRPAAEAFDDVPSLKIKGEMLDLAKHIIETKRGTFDPAAFDDRYEAAVAELVRAKLEGKPIARRKAQPKGEVIDLMEALRQSASGRPTARKAPADKSPKRQAKAKPAVRPKKHAATPKSKAAAPKRRKAG